MLDTRLPLLPHGWAVWALSDSHGMVDELLAALRQTRLVDEGGHWSAPASTALVGYGDYIDRGPDSRGMLGLLRRLGAEAAAAHRAAHLARGNHEEMAIHKAEGYPGWLDIWKRFGGDACFDSFGLDAGHRSRASTLTDAIETAEQGTFDSLRTLPQAVRWRDGPTLCRDGHSLGFDTGAAKPAADGSQRTLTLVGLQGLDLAAAHIVSVPTTVDAAIT